MVGAGDVGKASAGVASDSHTVPSAAAGIDCSRVEGRPGALRTTATQNLIGARARRAGAFGLEPATPAGIILSSVMITPTCSKCGKAIPSEDVNVANDVAYCRTCNLSHKLSTLTQGTELDAGIDLNNPPAGAWFTNDGTGPLIGATHRSLGTAIGALAFGLFWNGIVSVFVLVGLAGTLRNLGIPLPHWIPAPNMNGSPMSVGMTIFLLVQIG